MGKSIRTKPSNGTIEQNREHIESGSSELNASGERSTGSDNGNTISGNTISGNITGVSDKRTAAARKQEEIKARKAQETLTIETETLDIPDVKGKRGRKAASKKEKPNGKAAATGLIEMVEIFAVARFGSQAAFAANERLLIEPALARLIEKYGSVAESFGGLLDPVLLCAGITLYAIRLSALSQVKPAVPVQNRQSDQPNEKPDQPIVLDDRAIHDLFRGVA